VSTQHQRAVATVLSFDSQTIAEYLKIVIEYNYNYMVKNVLEYNYNYSLKKRNQLLHYSIPFSK